MEAAVDACPELKHAAIEKGVNRIYEESYNTGNIQRGANRARGWKVFNWTIRPDYVATRSRSGRLAGRQIFENPRNRMILRSFGG
jgi:hypothetical protein